MSDFSLRESGDLGLFDNLNASSNSWDVAYSIIKKVKPVPLPLWVIMRFVYNNKLNNSVVPVELSYFKYILNQAINNLVSSNKSLEVQNLNLSLDSLISLIGGELGSSICYINCISRKVINLLPPKISNPILEEALLRVEIGYIIGEHSKLFSKGKNILTGFLARSGLALQFISADTDLAKKALEKLAFGDDLESVGLEIYGCSPLQVSSMSLIEGGFNRDVAYGISSIYEKSENELSESCFSWLSSFKINEYLREGKGELIGEKNWTSLGIDLNSRKEICLKVKNLLKYGSSWNWILMAPDDL